MTDLITRTTLPADLHAILTDAADARAKQLACLPERDGDLVAWAHRSSVTRILGEIRAAIERLDAGTYGDCITCPCRISVERLELVLWASRCTRCASL